MIYYITRSANGGPEVVVGGRSFDTNRPNVTYESADAAKAAIQAIRASYQGARNSRGGDLPVDYIVRQ
jgi:hypothetical protein